MHKGHAVFCCLSKMWSVITATITPRLFPCVVPFLMAAAPPGTAPSLPTPTHADVKYGPHERNVLDAWLANSEKPAPLLFYIHGGGWLAEDKNTISPGTLK